MMWRKSFIHISSIGKLNFIFYFMYNDTQKFQVFNFG